MTMYLGIDLGTSAVKSILMDEDQRVVGEASSRVIAVQRSHRGWSEQNPEDWWDAVCETLDALSLAQPAAMRAVAGIGLSGQMYGATLLDASDRPIRPAILWNDTRASAECRSLEEREPAFRSIAGRRATPGVTAPKLEWVRRHEPDAFARIATVLLPKDYVRLQLTGEKASDMADSSGTLWMNVARREWSERLLAATELGLGHMPRLVEGTEPTGTLRPRLAQRWRMARRPVVAGGGSDNACGACGSGVVAPGSGTLSLGTSGVLFVATEQAQASPEHAIETLCHAVPQVWHQMSVILSATACLNWLAALLKRPAYDLVRALGDTPQTATNLLFLPFLDGCWSPQDDAEIRGAFVGLEHGTDDAAMTRAVLQGVAFAMAEAGQGFRENGARFDRLLAIGGGSRSALWLSMMANAMGTTIAVPAACELGAAFGAARLGLIAATGSDPGVVMTSPSIIREIEPEPRFADDYNEAYERWRRLYQPIRAASTSLRPSIH